jgi:hypothetical protein
MHKYSLWKHADIYNTSTKASGTYNYALGLTDIWALV